jgi:F-type H+-transporting ATPase subunit epsilon
MDRSSPPEIASDGQTAQQVDRQIHLVVVTPERAFLDTHVDFVVVTLYDGEAGFLPGRTPLIGRLGFGELRTRTGDVVERYFVDGGFVQIRDNQATILTPRVIPAAEIDLAAAVATREQLEQARPQTLVELAERDKGLARARGLIRVANRQR